MKLNKNTVKRILPALGSALTVSLFLLILYAVYDFYPFGEHSVSWCDMDQQVIPLLLDLKHILQGKDSLLYAFTAAGGMNFIGVFYFFLASPLHLLVLFVPDEKMMMFMNVLTLLKCAAMAGASSYYLSRHKVHPAYAAAGGLLYAFCGYTLLFYQNTIWLDCAALFPLLLLSLEELTENRRMLPYILTIGAEIIVNYYIGYMVVLFVLLYEGVTLFVLKGRHRQEVATKFIIGSALAALVTAITWMPSLLQVFATSARAESITESISNGSFFTSLNTVLPVLFGSVLPLSLVVYGLLHFPPAALEKESPEDALFLRVDLVMLGLTLVPVFLEPINRMWHTGNYMSFPSRHAFLSIFMIIALSGRYLNLMELSPRFVDGRLVLEPLPAYVIAASAATSQNNEPSAAEAASAEAASAEAAAAEAAAAEAAFAPAPTHRAHLRRFSLSDLLMTALFLGLMILLLKASMEFIETNLTSLTVYTRKLWGNKESLAGQALVTFPVLLLSAVLVLLLIKKHLPEVLCLVLMFCLVLTQAAGGVRMFVLSGEKESRVTMFNAMVDVSVFEPDEEEDGTFYRVKQQKKSVHANLLGAFGYSSIGHYTSLTSETYLYAMKLFGYSAYWMEVTGNGGSLLSDAFMSIRYNLADTGRADLGPVAYAGDSLSFYENESILGLGVLSSVKNTDTNGILELGRFEVQEKLFETLFPDASVLETLMQVEPSSTENLLIGLADEDHLQLIREDKSVPGHIYYTIEVTGRTHLYFDAFNALSNNLTEKVNGSFNVYVNDTLVAKQYPAKTSNGLLDLGTFENETVTIEADLLKDCVFKSYGLYAMDCEAVSEAVSEATTLDFHFAQRSSGSFGSSAVGAILTSSAHTDKAGTVYLSLPYDKGLSLTIDGQKAELRQAFYAFCSFELEAGDHEIVISCCPPGLIPGACLSVAALALSLFLCLSRTGKKLEQKVLALQGHLPLPLQQVCVLLTLILFAAVIGFIYAAPMVIYWRSLL